MASKKIITRVVDSTSTIDEIDTEMQKAQEKWICLKERRHQARKECLIHFGTARVTGDEARDEKTQNKIIKIFQKEKQRQNRFRCVTNDVGRGRNKCLKN